MTPAERDAFSERIAVMEFDGKLPHKTAVFAAFERCFPGDYRECISIAAETPDGEDCLIEFLEELFKKGKLPAGRKKPLSGFEKLAEYARGSL